MQREREERAKRAEERKERTEEERWSVCFFGRWIEREEGYEGYVYVCVYNQ